MKKRLRVSIVIPAYNEERHLAASLDAIATQTSPVLEVIVVDNNSTDQTVAIAKRYPFVRVIRESTQGRVFARNAGFNAAKGDIIGRCDADIRLPAHWVEHIQDFYADERHTNQAWTGGGFFTNVRLPHLVSATYRFMTFRLNWLLLGTYSMWGSNMALRNEQWQAVAQSVHLRNDIHEDLDLGLHLHEAGYGITYDRKILVHGHLRRVNTNRDQLWDYLQWWPRTLRIHGKWTWVICWLFGGLLMYFAAYVLVIANLVAKLFHKPKRAY